MLQAHVRNRARWVQVRREIDKLLHHLGMITGI